MGIPFAVWESFLGPVVQGIGNWMGQESQNQQIRERWAKTEEEIKKQQGWLEPYNTAINQNVADITANANNALLAYNTDSATMMNAYAGRNRTLLDTVDSRNKALIGDWSTGSADILRGYNSRWQRAMAMNEGLGQQEGKDIAERWRRERASSSANLRSRGLGATTIGSAMNAGLAREETADQARLQERLRRERIGLDTSLSGEMLGAQEGLFRGGISLKQDTNNQYLSANERLSGEYLDTLNEISAGRRAIATGTAAEIANAKLNAAGQIYGNQSALSDKYIASVNQQPYTVPGSVALLHGVGQGAMQAGSTLAELQAAQMQAAATKSAAKYGMWGSAISAAGSVAGGYAGRPTYNIAR